MDRYGKSWVSAIKFLAAVFPGHPIAERLLTGKLIRDFQEHRMSWMIDRFTSLNNPLDLDTKNPAMQQVVANASRINGLSG